MPPTPAVRRFAVAYLGVQAAGCLAWWAALAAWPPARGPFKPAGAPDAALLAFAPADLVLFAGGSAAAAAGVAGGRPWAWPALLVHAGAAAYAGLYCLALPLVAGGSGWAAAACMAPAAVVPPWLAWALRPTRPGGDPC